MDIYEEIDRFLEENLGEASITDTAKHFFKLGQNNPNWISVKDELPPVDEDYVKQGFAKPDEEGNTLTASTTVLVTDGKYVETTFYMFELKRWNSQMDDTKITHWMPLPQPPRKEE